MLCSAFDPLWNLRGWRPAFLTNYATFCTLLITIQLIVDNFNVVVGRQLTFSPCVSLQYTQIRTNSDRWTSAHV